MSLSAKLYQMYEHAPGFVRNTLGNAFYLTPSRIRYGRTYENILALDKKYEFASVDEIRDYQSKKLRELLRFAYDTVPFYKRHYDAYGIDILAVRQPEDLVKLPTIDRRMILAQPDDFISTAVDRTSLHLSHTSGTSGQRLGVYFDPNNKIEEWGHVIAFWSRIGYDISQKRAEFRSAKDLGGKPFVYDPLTRKLAFDIFLLGKDAIAERFADEIDRHKIRYLYGYPSLIELFCKSLQKSGRTLKLPIKAVLAASEMVHNHQREFIEGFLKTRVFSFYGHSERAIFAGECPVSTHYHCNPVYGITEILLPDGSPVEAGQMGELTGTGFSNFGMPFIRYRTNDYASWMADKCCCGRNHLVIKKVYGRSGGEKLITKDMRPITALIRPAMLKNVMQFQFVQDVPGKAVLLLVPQPGFSKEDEAMIAHALWELTRGEIETELHYVESIPIRGKNTLIQQNIDLDKINDSNSRENDI